MNPLMTRAGLQLPADKATGIPSLFLSKVASLSWQNPQTPSYHYYADGSPFYQGIFFLPVELGWAEESETKCVRAAQVWLIARNMVIFSSTQFSANGRYNFIHFSLNKTFSLSSISWWTSVLILKLGCNEWHRSKHRCVVFLWYVHLDSFVYVCREEV